MVIHLMGSCHIVGSHPGAWGAVLVENCPGGEYSPDTGVLYWWGLIRVGVVQ